MTDYQFVKDDDGALLLVLAVPASFPDHPRIFYDGGPHALFCRTPSDVHVLWNIPADIRSYLAYGERVGVMEQGAEAPYMARCVFEHDIPALVAIKGESSS